MLLVEMLFVRENRAGMAECISLPIVGSYDCLNFFFDLSINGKKSAVVVVLVDKLEANDISGWSNRALKSDFGGIVCPVLPDHVSEFGWKS
jgi:hypothetical protein